MHNAQGAEMEGGSPLWRWLQKLNRYTLGLLQGTRATNTQPQIITRHVKNSKKYLGVKDLNFLGRADDCRAVEERMVEFPWGVDARPAVMVEPRMHRIMTTKA